MSTLKVITLGDKEPRELTGFDIADDGLLIFDTEDKIISIQMEDKSLRELCEGIQDYLEKKTRI